jgi:hypothetical protein
VKENNQITIQDIQEKIQGTIRIADLTRKETSQEPRQEKKVDLFREADIAQWQGNMEN